MTPARDPRNSPVGKLVGFCLDNKLIVILLVVLMVGWGFVVSPFDWQAGPLPRDPVPVDAIPDLGENQQIIFTEWAGRSPQDVEDQITYPLTVSLLGLPRVKTVRSYSFFGFSSIYVIFEEKAAPLSARTPPPWARFSGTHSRAGMNPAARPAAGIPPNCGPSRIIS